MTTIEHDNDREMTLVLEPDAEGHRVAFTLYAIIGTEASGARLYLRRGWSTSNALVPELADAERTLIGSVRQPYGDVILDVSPDESVDGIGTTGHLELGNAAAVASFAEAFCSGRRSARRRS